jgi:hypothetical protein
MKQVWSFKELVGLWKIWGSSLIFARSSPDTAGKRSGEMAVRVCSRP